MTAGAVPLLPGDGPSAASGEAQVGDVAVTTALLAALLAAPGDPTGAGALGSPVHVTLSGTRRRLLSTEEQGWRLDPSTPLRRASGPLTPGPERAPVARVVATAVLDPEGLPGSGPRRLPENG